MARTNKHKYEWKRQWRSLENDQLEMNFEKENPNQLKLFNDEIHTSASIQADCSSQGKTVGTPFLNSAERNYVN